MYILYIIQFSVVLECMTVFELHFLLIRSLFAVDSRVKTRAA